MSDLVSLANIGPVLAAKLEAAGVHNRDDLRELGSIEAILKIRGHLVDDSCLNMLYALEGAIRGVRWHKIPSADRARLRQKLREAARPSGVAPRSRRY